MNYRYGAILNNNSEYFRKSTEYLVNERDECINILQKVEEKQLEVQQEFDIFNPNITFMIGEYLFNKETYSLNITANIDLIGNNISFIFLKESSSSLSYYGNSVSHIDNIAETTSYIDSYFLTKKSSTHEVLWLYDIGAESMQIEEGHTFQEYDILPFTFAYSIFYRKVEEYFPELHVMSHDITKAASIVSKEISIRELNKRSSNSLVCVPTNSVGESFQIYDNYIYVENDISIYTNYFSFSSLYIFTDNSPANYEYMHANFMLRNLSNIDKFIVIESELLNIEDLEIISEFNFSEIKSLLLPIDSEYIDDSYYIENSGGANAVTFKHLHYILTDKLSKFYALQLKLFLGGYTGTGPLGELIEYIKNKIKEIMSKYVYNDECDSIPLNNIDEGCIIECDNLFLDEAHLMVTKQKLKAVLRCALTC